MSILFDAAAAKERAPGELIVVRARGLRAPVVRQPSSSSSSLYVARASLALGASYARRMQIVDAWRAEREDDDEVDGFVRISHAPGTFQDPRGSMKGRGNYSDATRYAFVGLRAVTGAPSCEACPAGTFSSTEESLACTACPKDTYSAAPASIACTPCPAGTSTTGTGATSASACIAPVSSTAYATLRIGTSSASLDITEASGATMNYAFSNSISNQANSAPTYIAATATSPAYINMPGPNTLMMTGTQVKTLASNLKTAYTVNIWSKSNTYSLVGKELDMFGIGTSANNSALGLKFWATSTGYWHQHSMWYNNDSSTDITVATVPSTTGTLTTPTVAVLNAENPKRYHMYTITASITASTKSTSGTTTNTYTRRVYMNGVLVATDTTQAIPYFDAGSPTLYLGRFVNSWTSAVDTANVPITHSIAGFRVWTRELSATELTSLYSEGAK